MGRGGIQVLKPFSNSSTNRVKAFEACRNNER